MPFLTLFSVPSRLPIFWVFSIRNIFRDSSSNMLDAPLKSIRLQRKARHLRKFHFTVVFQKTVTRRSKVIFYGA